MNEIRVKAICPVPRYVSSASFWQIQQALRCINLSTDLAQGVFWHEAMEREYERAIDAGYDCILAVDSDSMFSPEQAIFLLQVFGTNDHIGALAALQVARNRKHALAWKDTNGEFQAEWSSDTPFKVTLAHFGLTVIRCSLLADLPKPWFKPIEDDRGGWGEGHVHADIWFWQQWQKAGYSVWLDPRVKIGHLEDMVTCLDEQNQYQVLSLAGWREYADRFATRYREELAFATAGGD